MTPDNGIPRFDKTRRLAVGRTPIQRLYMNGEYNGQAFGSLLRRGELEASIDSGVRTEEVPDRDANGNTSYLLRLSFATGRVDLTRGAATRFTDDYAGGAPTQVTVFRRDGKIVAIGDGPLDTPQTSEQGQPIHFT